MSAPEVGRVLPGVRAQCGRCGKILTPQVPKGGDGSALVFRRHNGVTGRRCDGSRSTVLASELLRASDEQEGRA